MSKRSDFLSFLKVAEERLSGSRLARIPLQWCFADPQRKDAALALIWLYGYGAPDGLRERFRESAFPGLSTVLKQAQRTEKRLADLSSIQGLRQSGPPLGSRIEILRAIYDGASYMVDKCIANKQLCETRSLAWLFQGFAHSYHVANTACSDYTIEGDLADVFCLCGLRARRYSQEAVYARMRRFKLDPARADEYGRIAQYLRKQGTFPPPRLELGQWIACGDYLGPKSPVSALPPPQLRSSQKNS